MEDGKMNGRMGVAVGRGCPYYSKVLAVTVTCCYCGAALRYVTEAGSVLCTCPVAQLPRCPAAQR